MGKTKTQSKVNMVVLHCLAKYATAWATASLCDELEPLEADDLASWVSGGPKGCDDI